MTKRLSLTVPEMRSHILGLCTSYKLQLVEDSAARYEQGTSLQGLNGRGEAVVQLVAIKPVSDEASYCIGLHEIGHCVDPLGWTPSVTKLTREYAAWDWAEHNALCWTPTMEHTKILCLQSYERSVETERQQSAAQAQKNQADRTARKSFIKRLL